MLEEIRRVIAKWRSNDLTNRSEAIVCLGLIIPVLHRLGWDVASVDEVHPQYPVGGGKVDFALLHDQVPKVFIEAKKEDEPLDGHQEQLLNYAFRLGVAMAVLTNGTTWWFYLPLSEGSWENRKFAAVDINEPELPQRLISLLSKENVISGENTQSAETLLRYRRILENLPRAWEAVRPEIVNRLIDETEELCGYRPNTNEVQQFLSRINNQTASEAAAPEPPVDTSSEAPESDDVAGMRPRCFTFLEGSYSVRTWKSVLTKLCGVLHTRHRNRFEAAVLDLRSSKGNPYFSRNADDLREPRRVNESGIFVESNMSAKYILNTARMLISHFGYAPSDFRVEYSPRK